MQFCLYVVLFVFCDIQYLLHKGKRLKVFFLFFSVYCFLAKVTLIRIKTQLYYKNIVYLAHQNIALMLCDILFYSCVVGVCHIEW